MKYIKRRAFTVILAGVLSIVLMLGVLAYATTAADSKNGNNVLGIMYHQISTTDANAGEYIIPEYVLESDFKYLSENGYTAVLPSELAQLAQNGDKVPEKSVIITFDDGHETMLLTVLPLLKKYNLKAVVNIVGSYTDKYSSLSEEEKHPSYSYLSWDEVKTLCDSGIVEIGNHTDNMHEITEARMGCGKSDCETDEEYYSALYYDVMQLQNKAEKNTAIRPITFAYPYGLISNNSRQILTDAGFKVLMTCRELPTAVTNLPVIVNRYNRAYDRDIRNIIWEYENSL